MIFLMTTLEERKKQIEDRVTALVEPLLEYNGLELVLVEYVKGPRGNILRLVMDKEGGVTLDDCTRISRIVSDLLDVHDPVPGSYNLEVSSPGINRPLVKIEDYERFAGQKVVIKMVRAMDGRKRFKGMLKGVRHGNIVVESADGEFVLPIDEIKKARLDII